MEYLVIWCTWLLWFILEWSGALAPSSYGFCVTVLRSHSNDARHCGWWRWWRKSCSVPTTTLVNSHNTDIATIRLERDRLRSSEPSQPRHLHDASRLVNDNNFKCYNWQEDPSGSGLCWERVRMGSGFIREISFMKPCRFLMMKWMKPRLLK